MIFELGGITFNPEPDAADSNGVYWYVTALDGWDSPDVRQSYTNPTSRHGAVAGRSLLAGRALVLSGVVKAPTVAGMWDAVEVLDAATNNLYQTRPFKVHEGTTIKYVDVVRSGALRKTLVGQCAFSFQIPLIAPDPLKYADSLTTQTFTTGATHTLNNTGSFPTENIQIEMGYTGVIDVVNADYGAKGLLGDRSVPSGTFFDVYRRSIDNGEAPSASNYRSFMQALSPLSVWWTLQPGDNDVTNNGSGSITITYRSAWL